MLVQATRLGRKIFGKLTNTPKALDKRFAPEATDGVGGRSPKASILIFRGNYLLR